ncbi:MAG: Sulfatase [uncultured Chloroflexi bacterium]|uniref:Sulfatase n=1 Tax=uncultured Chloroflexota bacterium TaxID=166587 RepID=A0A6J4HKK8_9CHLR|nr:MAG: Sulfatase [uncultured Chloroflexota bacterium]
MPFSTQSASNVSSTGATSTTRPNVLVLAVDTQRADHLSCYGYPRLTSPHIDRLASQGLLFEDAYSEHIPTHPGYTTLFTGKDVFSHQIVTQGGTVELDPGVRQLAEILREQGYFTGAADNLGRWFDRGFDAYERYRWDQTSLTEWRKAEAVNGALLPLLERAAAAAGKGGKDQPFFVYAHYWDPHTPYLPPPPFSRMFYTGDERDKDNHSMDPVFGFEPFREYFQHWMGGVTDIRFPIAQYDAEIAYVDAALGHVFTFLEETGLAENTLVVLTADHGEILDDHVGYFDHHGLYEGNVHVPLLMRLPGRLPAGKRVPGFARLRDVAPTILEAIGLPDVAAQERMEGRSLWAAATSRRAKRTGIDALYLTECTWMRKRAWRTRDWKLIQAQEPDFHDLPPLELYHLQADPQEQHNLADARPDVVTDLLGRMELHATRRLARTGLPDPLQSQSITLRRIGQVKTAVPEDQKLKA